jgi:hypothetical protein
MTNGGSTMPILTKPSFGPRTSIIYITVGALMDVWVAVWYFAFGRGEGEALSRSTQFWLLGIFLTGLTLIIIGAFLGSIGRAARKVEMPPPSAVNKEAQIQQTAAANPPVMMAPMPAPAAQPMMPAQPVAPPAAPPGYVTRQ